MFAKLIAIAEKIEERDKSKYKISDRAYRCRKDITKMRNDKCRGYFGILPYIDDELRCETRNLALNRSIKVIKGQFASTAKFRI